MTRYTKNQLRIMASQGVGAELPPPTPKKKRDNEEFRVQSAFTALWRANCMKLGIAQCLAFHIPNGSVMGSGNAEWQKKERAIRGRLQKLAGVEDGVVDYFVSVPRGIWHGFYIEFKKPGGVASPEQELFMGFATAQGYKCEVHTNAIEAWASLLRYLNPNSPNPTPPTNPRSPRPNL